jgi:hypothetical protein
MHAAAAGNPSQRPPRGPENGPRERRPTFLASLVLRDAGLERRSVTPTVKPHCLGFPADSHIFEHVAPVGRPSSPFFNGILGRALARLGDTGGRYCRLWHLRGNVSMSPLAAPMPPGLSWSSPTCLCTPEIAASSPPGGRWLSISLHAAMQPCSR